MYLTVENNIIANLAIQAVQLRKSIGAFDLALVLAATTNPPATTTGAARPRWARIDGIEVHVQSPRGSGRLAILRPAVPARLEQTANALTQQVEFQATVQRRQLLELEDLRGGKDLQLRLVTLGAGGGVDDPVGRSPIYNDHPYVVSRSDWANQLNGAGAMGLLLLEVAIPVTTPVADEGIADRLHSAERAFHDGDYGGCIGHCRLAYDRAGLKDAPKPKLVEKPQTMSFAERIDLLIIAARHCTHPPHHDDADAIAEHAYSREEARLILHITASALAFRLND